MSKPELTKPCKIPMCAALIQMNVHAYAYRYSVCSEHLRASSVDVGGEFMRFCQKCSCLHPLQAFGGAQRSCKKRLVIQRQQIKKTKKVCSVQPRVCASACKPPPLDAENTPPAEVEQGAQLYESLEAVFCGNACDSLYYDLLPPPAKQNKDIVKRCVRAARVSAVSHWHTQSQKRGRKAARRRKIC